MYLIVKEQIQITLEERVNAVSHSFADPTPYVPAAHTAGTKVLAQVQKVSHAQKVALAGIDAVAAQGNGAGGHTGYHSTLPMVLGHRLLRNRFVEAWHGREDEALARAEGLRAEIEAADLRERRQHRFYQRWSRCGPDHQYGASW